MEDMERPVKHGHTAKEQAGINRADAIAALRETLMTATQQSRRLGYRTVVVALDDLEAILAALAPADPINIDPTLCDCNYEPIRGIKAGRHLPSCRYGIIEDWIDGRKLYVRD